ncbi:hypothetical protein PFISCL1PPCAC_4242, partial [Pristionchus fissidentatus]
LFSLYSSPIHPSTSSLYVGSPMKIRSPFNHESPFIKHKHRFDGSGTPEKLELDWSDVIGNGQNYVYCNKKGDLDEVDFQFNETEKESEFYASSDDEEEGYEDKEEDEQDSDDSDLSEPSDDVIVIARHPAKRRLFEDQSDDVFVNSPPAKRRFFDIDPQPLNVEEYEINDQEDEKKREEKLKDDASSARQDGPEERIFTHYVEERSFTLIIPFIYPPRHGRFSFPLSENDINFLTKYVPDDWRHHLYDESGFRDFASKYRFKGSEYRRSVLLKRAFWLGTRIDPDEKEAESNDEVEPRRPNMKR